jgi:apolipoprotein N-acyltransferase
MTSSTLPPRVAWLLALASGTLYFLGFAGFDIWPLAFVAFVPFLLALEGQAPKRAWKLGLLMGTVMNVGGFYWLLNMLRTFSGFPTILCAFFMTVVCAYQGGRMALTAWLYARIRERGFCDGARRYVAFGGAFIAGEMLYPVLFPWYFGASVHQVPMFLQVADLGGPVLVGLVILAFNIAFSEWLIAKHESRAPYKRILQVGFALPLLTAIYGLVRIHHTDGRVSVAEPVQVGLVQGNLGLMQKRLDPYEGLSRHVRLTSELKQKGAELVVWSESSVTFPIEESNMQRFMHDSVAAKLELPAIFGGVLYRQDPDRERWYNTALASDKQGNVVSRYDKHFLLMFGEYLPLGDVFPVLYKWSPHSGKFSPGTHARPLEVETRGKKHSVTALICYEDILPGFTNDAVREGNPELLVNLTNDAWFGDTAEPWEHLALAKLRAVEHHRYLLRSTNSGVSAIIDPSGRINARTNTFVETTLLGTVHYLSGKTVYEYLGDKLWYLCSIATVVFAYLRRQRLQPDVATTPNA